MACSDVAGISICYRGGDWLSFVDPRPLCGCQSQGLKAGLPWGAVVAESCGPPACLGASYSGPYQSVSLIQQGDTLVCEAHLPSIDDPDGFPSCCACRSNGFEQKRFSRISSKKAVQELAYKWSVEDM